MADDPYTKGQKSLIAATIDRETVWQCPCGVTGPYAKVMGHRRGWRNRPSCQGEPFVVGGPGHVAPEESPVLAAVVEPTGHNEAASSQPTPDDAPPLLADEIESDDADGPPQTDDPEEMARWLNQQRERGGETLGDLWADASNGIPTVPPIFAGGGSNGRPPTGYLDGEPMGEGDYRIQQPPDGTPISQERPSVLLPISVIVMYDWARSRGWHQGDGSLSAFITDIVLDHWRNCWKRAIVVVNREEVALA